MIDVLEYADEVITITSDGTVTQRGGPALADRNIPIDRTEGEQDIAMDGTTASTDHDEKAPESQPGPAGLSRASVTDRNPQTEATLVIGDGQVWLYFLKRVGLLTGLPVLLLMILNVGTTRMQRK
jgi:hypothetical protein